MNHEERSGKQQQQATSQTFPAAMDGINGWDCSPSHVKTLCSPLLPSKVQKHDHNLGEETERAACNANRVAGFFFSIWEIIIRTAKGDDKQQAPFPYL